jgi:hypothetical protein
VQGSGFRVQGSGFRVQGVVSRVSFSGGEAWPRGAVVEGVGRIRKVDVRLTGKRNSNSHGARPVHLIITMIKWIRTSRLSIKNSL